MKKTSTLFLMVTILLPVLGAAAGMSPNLEIRYSQSLAAWQTLSEIKGAEGNLSAVNSVLRDKYGSFQESFGTIGGRIPGVFGKRGYLGLRAEAVGYGLVQNPVVPELHASAMLAALAETGLQARARDFDFSTGLVLGVGREKRIDAYSTDLIDAMPIRNGRFLVMGLEAESSRRFRLSRVSAIDGRISIKETAFHTTTPRATLASSMTDSEWRFSHRWQAKVTGLHAVKAPLFKSSRVFIDGIAGPQPLPVDIFPTTWDYTHTIHSLPELGAMLGAGAGFTGSWGSLGPTPSSFRVQGGMYGGYLGGEIAVRVDRFSFTAETWGIENSSAYQTLGQRLWLGSFGVYF